jgi:hypothetical protein
MAETYALDPALVRIGWALLILFTGGVFLVVYIVIALVVPLRPMGMTAWSGGPTPGGVMSMPYAAMPNPGPAGTGPAESGSLPPPPPSDSPGMPPPAYQPYPPPAYATHRERHGSASGAVVLGTILVLVGAFFLIRQFVPALDIGAIWPVAIIIGGGLLIALAFRRQP